MADVAKSLKRQRSADDEYPFRIIFETTTEDGQTAYLRILDRALKMLIESGDNTPDVLYLYQTMRAKVPQQAALQFAPNVVYVTPERWRKR